TQPAQRLHGERREVVRREGVAGKLVAVNHQDTMAPLREEEGQAGPSHASSDDEHVVLHACQSLPFAVNARRAEHAWTRVAEGWRVQMVPARIVFSWNLSVRM